MKVISISGFILSILSFLTGLYLQFILAPAASSLEASLDTGESDPINSLMFYAAEEAKVNTAEILLIMSGVALILCVIAAIKTKSKMGIIGATFSFLGLMAGIVYGTHMFS